MPNDQTSRDLVRDFLNAPSESAVPSPATPSQPTTPQVAQSAEPSAAPAASPVAEVAPATSVPPTGGSDDGGLPEDVARKANIGDILAPPAAQAATKQAAASTPSDELTPPPEVAAAGKKGVDAWTAAKREAKEVKRQMDALNQELTELKAKAGQTSTTEVEGMKTKMQELEAKLKDAESGRAALENQVGQLDLSKTKAFKDKFDVPLNTKFKQGVQDLSKAGIDAKTAQDLMTRLIDPSRTDEQIQDMLQDLPPLIQGSVYHRVTEMIQGQKQRAAALKDWKATQAAMSEQTQRERETAQSKAMEQSLDTAMDKLREEGSWLFMKSDTNDNWNTQLSERIDAVRGVLQSGDAPTLAKYVADGLAARTYRTLYEAKSKEVNKLVRELEISRGAQPSLGGEGSLAQPVDSTKVPVKEDDWLRKMLRT